MDPSLSSSTSTPLTSAATTSSSSPIATSSLGKSRSGVRSNEPSPSPTSPTLKRPKSHHYYQHASSSSTPDSLLSDPMMADASTSTTAESPAYPLHSDVASHPSGDKPKDNPASSTNASTNTKSSSQAPRTPSRRPNRTRVRQEKHLQNEQQRRLFINNRIWELGDLLPNIPAHARVDKSGNQKPLTKIYILNKVIAFVKKAMEYPAIVDYFREEMEFEDVNEPRADGDAAATSSNGNTNHTNASTSIGFVSPAVSTTTTTTTTTTASAATQNVSSDAPNTNIQSGDDEGDDDDDDDDLNSPTTSITPSTPFSATQGPPAFMGMPAKPSSSPMPGSLLAGQFVSLPSAISSGTSVHLQQQRKRGSRSSLNTDHGATTLQVVKHEDEASDSVGPILVSPATHLTNHNTIITPRRHSTGFSPLLQFSALQPLQPNKRSQTLGAQPLAVGTSDRSSNAGSGMHITNLHEFEHNTSSDLFSHPLVPVKATSPVSESDAIVAAARPRSQSNSKSPSVLVQSLSLSTPMNALSSQSHTVQQHQAPLPSQSQLNMQQAQQHSQPFMPQYDALLHSNTSPWHLPSSAEANFQSLATTAVDLDQSTSSTTTTTTCATSSTNMVPSSSALSMQHARIGTPGATIERQVSAQHRQYQILQPHFQGSPQQQQQIGLLPDRSMASAVPLHHQHLLQQQPSQQQQRQQQRIPQLLSGQFSPQQQLQYQYQAQQLQQQQYQHVMAAMNPLNALSLGGLQGEQTLQLAQQQQQLLPPPPPPQQQQQQQGIHIQQSNDFQEPPAISATVVAPPSVTNGTIGNAVVSEWQNNAPAQYGEGSIAVAPPWTGTPTNVRPHFS